MKEDMADGVKNFFAWASTSHAAQQSKELVSSAKSSLKSPQNLNSIINLLQQYETTTKHSLAQDAIIKALAEISFEFSNSCSFETLFYHAQCALEFKRGFKNGDCPTSDTFAAPLSATIEILKSRKIIGGCINMTRDNIPVIKKQISDMLSLRPASVSSLPKLNILIVFTGEHAQDCPALTYYPTIDENDSAMDNPCNLPPCSQSSANGPNPWDPCPIYNEKVNGHLMEFMLLLFLAANLPVVMVNAIGSLAISFHKQTSFFSSKITPPPLSSPFPDAEIVKILHPASILHKPNLKSAIYNDNVTPLQQRFLNLIAYRTLESALIYLTTEPGMVREEILADIYSQVRASIKSSQRLLGALYKEANFLDLKSNIMTLKQASHHFHKDDWSAINVNLYDLEAAQNTIHSNQFRSAFVSIYHNKENIACRVEKKDLILGMTNNREIIHRATSEYKKPGNLLMNGIEVPFDILQKAKSIRYFLSIFASSIHLGCHKLLTRIKKDESQLKRGNCHTLIQSVKQVVEVEVMSASNEANFIVRDVTVLVRCADVKSAPFGLSNLMNLILNANDYTDNVKITEIIECQCIAVMDSENRLYTLLPIFFRLNDDSEFSYNPKSLGGVLKALGTQLILGQQCGGNAIVMTWHSEQRAMIGIVQLNVEKTREFRKFLLDSKPQIDLYIKKINDLTIGTEEAIEIERMILQSPHKFEFSPDGLGVTVAVGTQEQDRHIFLAPLVHSTICRIVHRAFTESQGGVPVEFEIALMGIQSVYNSWARSVDAKKDDTVENRSGVLQVIGIFSNFINLTNLQVKNPINPDYCLDFLVDLNLDCAESSVTVSNDTSVKVLSSLILQTPHRIYTLESESSVADFKYNPRQSPVRQVRLNVSKTSPHTVEVYKRIRVKSQNQPHTPQKAQIPKRHEMDLDSLVDDDLDVIEDTMNLSEEDLNFATSAVEIALPPTAHPSNSDNPNLTLSTNLLPYLFESPNTFAALSEPLDLEDRHQMDTGVEVDDVDDDVVIADVDNFDNVDDSQSDYEAKRTSEAMRKRAAPSIFLESAKKLSQASSRKKQTPLDFDLNQSTGTAAPLNTKEYEKVMELFEEKAVQERKDRKYSSIEKQSSVIQILSYSGKIVDGDESYISALTHAYHKNYVFNRVLIISLATLREIMQSCITLADNYYPKNEYLSFIVDASKRHRVPNVSAPLTLIPNGTTLEFILSLSRITPDLAPVSEISKESLRKMRFNKFLSLAYDIGSVKRLYTTLKISLNENPHTNVVQFVDSLSKAITTSPSSLSFLALILLLECHHLNETSSLDRVVSKVTISQVTDDYYSKLEALLIAGHPRLIVKRESNLIDVYVLKLSWSGVKNNPLSDTISSCFAILVKLLEDEKVKEVVKMSKNKVTNSLEPGKSKNSGIAKFVGLLNENLLILKVADDSNSRQDITRSYKVFTKEMHDTLSDTNQTPTTIYETRRSVIEDSVSYFLSSESKMGPSRPTESIDLVVEGPNESSIDINISNLHILDKKLILLALSAHPFSLNSPLSLMVPTLTVFAHENASKSNTFIAILSCLSKSFKYHHSREAKRNRDPSHLKDYIYEEMSCSRIRFNHKYEFNHERSRNKKLDDDEEEEQAKGGKGKGKARVDGDGDQDAVGEEDEKKSLLSGKFPQSERQKLLDYRGFAMDLATLGSKANEVIQLLTKIETKTPLHSSPQTALVSETSASGASTESLAFPITTITENPAGHKCPFCQRNFKLAGIPYKKHIAACKLNPNASVTDTSSKSMKCRKCERVFKTLKPFEKHSMDCESYKCSTCVLKFSEEDDLYEHILEESCYPPQPVINKRDFEKSYFDGKSEVFQPLHRCHLISNVKSWISNYYHSSKTDVYQNFKNAGKYCVENGVVCPLDEIKQQPFHSRESGGVQVSISFHAPSPEIIRPDHPTEKYKLQPPKSVTLPTSEGGHSKDFHKTHGLSLRNVAIAEEDNAEKVKKNRPVVIAEYARIQFGEQTLLVKLQKVRPKMLLDEHVQSYYDLRPSYEDLIMKGTTIHYNGNGQVSLKIPLARHTVKDNDRPFEKPPIIPRIPRHKKHECEPDSGCCFITKTTKPQERPVSLSSSTDPITTPFVETQDPSISSSTQSASTNDPSPQSTADPNRPGYNKRVPLVYIEDVDKNRFLKNFDHKGIVFVSRPIIPGSLSDGKLLAAADPGVKTLATVADSNGNIYDVGPELQQRLDFYDKKIRKLQSDRDHEINEKVLNACEEVDKALLSRSLAIKTGADMVAVTQHDKAVATARENERNARAKAARQVNEDRRIFEQENAKALANDRRDKFAEHFTRKPKESRNHPPTCHMGEFKPMSYDERIKYYQNLKNKYLNVLRELVAMFAFCFDMFLLPQLKVKKHKDIGFRKLYHMIQWKKRLKGGSVLTVSEEFSTGVCPCCASYSPPGRSRVFECVDGGSCGFRASRDGKAGAFILISNIAFALMEIASGRVDPSSSVSSLPQGGRDEAPH